MSDPEALERQASRRHTSGCVVGIDLGTTHTVVAVGSDEGVAVLDMPQFVATGQLGRLKWLPSFLYSPVAGERFDAGEAWADGDWVIGEHARRRGLESAGRVIASAKSWLCHPGVDRTKAILPWQGRASTTGDSSGRISPVDASARILMHVRCVLTQRGLGARDDLPPIVLTVPASFDQVARSLTLEAARRAGLEVTLLEEPQAAFYDFLWGDGTSLLASQLVGRETLRVLVCDVGGGTTDLSLIDVSRGDERQPEAERIAVGRHLLLGGDNIDLALAHQCERQWSAQGKSLSPHQFAELTLSCRSAKERLLSENAPDSAPIRILGGGSSLIGATLGLELTREQVENVVFAGFLPNIPSSAAPSRTRSALRGFGLPYEADPALTHHVARFLDRHGAGRAAASASGSERVKATPIDAVLFNGGLFKAPRARKRVLEALETWLARPLLELPSAEPDLAVARGAVAFGLARQGRGRRIKSGAAVGLYVGLETHAGERRALCVVPRGAQEGEVFRVETHPLSVRTQQPIRFELYASDRARDPVGTIVAVDALERMPPVMTNLNIEGAAGSAPGTAAVALEGELSAVGTLRLGLCTLEESSRRYELEFELRQHDESPAADPAGRASSAAGPFTSAGASTRSVRGDAHDSIARIFGKGRKDVTRREVKDLWRTLEGQLGPRRQWELTLCRELSDVLLPLAKGRRRSLEHERAFFSLLGYTLRPGFGASGDDARSSTVGTWFSEGLAFGQERVQWEQFFIAWRRIAPGLSAEAQRVMRDLCDPFVASSESKLRRPKGFKALVCQELFEMLAWLERVDAPRRAAYGQWLLDRTWSQRDPKLWQWIGRVGARQPIYASAHYVVAETQARLWVEHLLSEDWTELPSAPAAALELARVTGDRTRDLDAALRLRVAKRLERSGSPDEWVQAVTDYLPLGAEAREASYGEELPVGLVLTESLEPKL